MNPALTSVCLLVIASVTRGDNVQLLSSASSGFSQRLYQKVASGQAESVIYSPYCIHSVLSMTSLGARGETATELNETLGLTALTGNTAHQAYHDLILQLNADTNVKVHTANAVFVNPNSAIEEQFINDVQSEYLARTSNFDLAAVCGPEKAINDFVNETTEGLIQNLIPPRTINSLTVIVLVNAIFFNGTWEKPFVEFFTQKQDFYKLGGATSQVDMMYDEERFLNIKRNVQGVDVAELPIQGGRFSLYIALPQTTDGITALETYLASPGYVDQLFQGLSFDEVRLSVPKFKIESKFELSSALQQLGIVRAFDASTANFQGISATGDLYISKVIHQTVIEVTETGTLAAAAGIPEPGASQFPPSEVFKADHPFVFFLRDNQSKNILFEGKFTG